MSVCGLRRWIGKKLLAWCLIAAGMVSLDSAIVHGQTTEPHSGSSAGPELDARVQQNPMERVIALQLRDVTLEEAVLEIGKLGKTTIVYRKELLPLEKRVSLQSSAISVADALAQVLATLNVVVSTSPNGMISLTAAKDVQQGTTGVVRGRVIDSATGKGLAGATVTVQGMAGSVLTSETGEYLIRDVPVGKQLVQVKLLHYKPVVRTVILEANKSATLEFRLVATTTMLSEVVTTAAGQQRRMTIGNSVTSLNVDSIMNAVPVRNLTDILDAGRVPGLIVSRANGAPGAPARIRIRGIGSINSTSDPIIIVDGVRSYSNQTTNEDDAQYSVLDRIDVNSIETIEVFKGPSASALYGSDAANGVIVVTTKRGTPGRTNWQVRTNQQWTSHPESSSPLLYYREGSALSGGKPGACLITVVCTNDTLLTYNYLDDPRTTVFGTGHRQEYSVSADGGSDVLRYFINGYTSSELGLLRMSNADVAYLEQTTGLPVPGWQRRPLANTQTGGTGRMNLQLTRTFSLALTSSLNRSLREETPLKNALAVLGRASPADSSLVTGSIHSFRQQTTYRDVSSRNVINGIWRPHAVFNLEADVGYDMLGRRSNALLRRGDCVNVISASIVCNMDGSLRANTENRSVGTVNMRMTVRPSKWKSIQITPTAGLNYTRVSENNVKVDANGLALGGTSTAGASEVDVNENSNEPISLGLFMSSPISLFNERLFTSLGLRVDASNALGANVRPDYPKLDLSYLISQEPWFPSRSTTLRLRLAYGHAAVQPPLGSTVQTYMVGTSIENGVIVPSLSLSGLGNIELRPERSTEFEGGFDLGLLNERLRFTVTQYRKFTRDMHSSRNVSLSLGEIGSQTINLGSVKNSGTELTFDGVLHESDGWRWSLGGSLSRNRNILVKLADGVTDAFFRSGDLRTFRARLVEGYPIDGLWMKPVVTYADLDGDGVLADNEILRSDSETFVGGPLPNFEMTLNPTLGLWRNRVTIALSTQYTDGKAQANQNNISGVLGNNPNARYNGALTRGRGGLRAVYDRSTPLEEQVATRTGYAFVHVVSALKVTSLSVRFIGPTALVRKLRARAMTIAIQGSNLGTWTNYSGSDPNVNDSIVGNLTSDSGNLPLPRTWGINVSLSY